MIWKEKRPLLTTLAGLLLLNAIFFLTYRVRYEERVNDLESRLADAEARLVEATARRAELERRFQRYRQVVSDIQLVYEEWWSTPEERLTTLLREVRSLAVRSQLVPQTVNYNLADQKKEASAKSMGIVFSVQGTYPRVRQLINMIELSKQFVTIDAISLAETGGDGRTLNLSLHLRTMFRDEEGKSRI
ncbi:MAG TPA: GspMb/PilO family protein [Thermoanaerobaculia bacterium]|nr:GspMb/PilO family protein [Thermoanaerobaculia bacterium]